MKICIVEVELLHGNRRRDSHTKLGAIMLTRLETNQQVLCDEKKTLFFESHDGNKYRLSAKCTIFYREAKWYMQ
jgi:hypothetical protein